MEGLGTKIVAVVSIPLSHKVVDVGMNWLNGSGKTYSSTLTGKIKLFNIVMIL